MEFIELFFSRLKAANVEYVHWKSNTNIEQALNNVDDLDILVHPKDKEIIFGIFKEMDIIKANSKTERWQRDIYNYIGLDINTQSLVHIHLHFRLTLGYDFDKCFDLPIVNEYLRDRWEYRGKVFLPSFENEYCILVIRLILKNALTPFLLRFPHHQYSIIKNAKSSGVVKGGGYREFIDLRQKIDLQKLERCLDTNFAFVNKSTFLLCETTLNDNNSVSAFIKSGKKLKKELRKYCAHGEARSFYKSFLRLNEGRLAIILRKLKIYDRIDGKKPENGGRIFAFVGGDGAGKTTTISTLVRTLKREFAVRSIHLGKPKRTFIGWNLRIVSKTLGLLGLRDTSKALIYLEVALNRKSAFKRACKLRDKGIIVILDRIPLEGLTAMDAPLIHTLKNKQFNWLSKIEENLHDPIKGVDKLFVLKLDPHIALKRRPEDDPDELLIRSGQIWDDKWHAPYGIIINTELNNPEEVQKIVLFNIWNDLKEPFLRTEFIGLSGTGKSTLVKSIVEKIPNTVKRIPIERFPFLVGKNLIIGGPRALYIVYKLKNKKFGWIYIHSKTSIDIIKYWIKTKKSLSNNFIFDQSVVYQLILLLYENVISEEYCISKLNEVSEFLPEVVMLSSSPEILWVRVKNRGGRFNLFRQKGAKFHDFTTFQNFCFRFDQSFSIIEKSNIKIKEINVSKITPSELTEYFMDYACKK